MSEAPRGPYVAEGPAHYRVLPPVVVDCSVLSGVLFLEPWQQQALDCLQGRAMHAPSLLQYEIASVAGRKSRQGFADLARDGLARFAEMDIALHPVDPVAMFDLAARYNLSAYDAAYLWLAAERKAALVSFDERLAQAARTHLASLP